MSLNLGNKEIKDIYLGSKKIKEVYHGSKKVYPIEKGYGKLCFRAVSNGTIQYSSSLDTNNIYVSQDRGSTWRQWNNQENINMQIDDEILVWNKNNTLSTSINKVLHFIFNCDVEILGDISSMINFAPLTPYCFFELFANNYSHTISAKNLILPYDVLADYCYYDMFMESEQLLDIPDLPATTLAPHCYDGMFYSAGINNTDLSDYTLPATTLAPYCYDGMFSMTKIVKPPKILATTLAEGCCQQMFSNCDYLTIGPDLLATNLAKKCYSQMFMYCTSIKSLKIYYTGTLPAADNATYQWFAYRYQSGTLYYNGPSTTSSTSAIPNSWSVSRF